MQSKYISNTFSSISKSFRRKSNHIHFLRPPRQAIVGESDVLMGRSYHADNDNGTSSSANSRTNITRIPFWNINVPPELHTEGCPPFLQYAIHNDKDRGMLSVPDSEFHRLPWHEVRHIIDENRIDLFRRLPSELRRYREYCVKLKQDYGSVKDFVLQERLKWTDVKPKGKPFTEPDDIKILYNDWPYGLDPRIVHIVVWTKFELKASDVNELNPHGDLTPEARAEINDYVDRTFVSVCGEENVIWFKNWASLKSIDAVEHFHVMLFDPDMDFVSRITGGDVPLAEKVGKPNALK